MWLIVRGKSRISSHKRQFLPQLVSQGRLEPQQKISENSAIFQRYYKRYIQRGVLWAILRSNGLGFDVSNSYTLRNPLI